MLNYKSGYQERKDKVFIFSFILSFSIHILLIFYILISYKGEDKKKEIVWVSFHTAASGQKDMNVGIGGSTSESNEDSSAYQNNSSHLKSDSSPLKSNQNDEIKKEEKKEDKVKKENNNNKDQQDRKEEIPKNKENITKNKENIKAEKSKYSNANIKKSSNEKKEIANAEKDIRSQNKQSVIKEEKNSKKESISQTASGRNNVKDKDLKDKKKEKYGTGKYTAKDLDELEKALRELAKSYIGGGGNRGDSKGGEGSGRSSGGGNMQWGTENGGAAQTFISLYAQLIRESIKKNFVIPPSLKGEFLSCVVYLKIGQDGSILDMDLEESSGNRNFDIFVMKAIRNSSPFPPPPSELEIYVRFSNRD
jgi:colicin import membrane protein